MLCTSIISLGNLMRIRVTSVEWTWLKLECLLAQYIAVNCELMSWWMLLWGQGYAQDFDPNIDLHSVDVDDIAPPILKLSDAKRHASLLSSFLLQNSLYFDVNEIIKLKNNKEFR